MPTSAPPSPLSPLARQLALLDKRVACAPGLFPGQMDAAKKRNPQLRAAMENIGRAPALGERIAFAIRAARAELAAQATGNTEKESKQ